MYKHVSACVFVSDYAEVFLFAHTSFDQRLLSQQYYLTIQHISELRLSSIDTALSSERAGSPEQMHKQVTAYYGCEIQKDGRAGEAAALTCQAQDAHLSLRNSSVWSISSL